MVLLFVMVEFWFDCITHTYFAGFLNGYSVLHFIVVYMVARYIYLYRANLMSLTKNKWIAAYIICTIIILIMYVTGVNYVWQYSNPIVVISAICSFMPFLYKSFVCRWVNWVAKSTLAVYIIHVTVPVYDLVVKYDVYILGHYPYHIYLLLAVMGVFLIFWLSILYDKVMSFFLYSIINCVSRCVNIKQYAKESS